MRKYPSLVVVLAMAWLGATTIASANTVMIFVCKLTRIVDGRQVSGDKIEPTSINETYRIPLSVLNKNDLFYTLHRVSAERDAEDDYTIDRASGVFTHVYRELGNKYKTLVPGWIKSEGKCITSQVQQKF